MWLNLLLASAILVVIVGVWFGVHWWLNPRIENPDAKASLIGICGDTMEIRLRFRFNRVAEASHWTNGCVYSLNCISAAADLAMGKTPEEVLDIDADTIQRSIGGLPTDNMHCATLAVATLQEAINDYMHKFASRPPTSSRFSRLHHVNLHRRLQQ